MTITLTFSSVEEYQAFLGQPDNKLPCTRIASLEKDLSYYKKTLSDCEDNLHSSELKVNELVERTQELECRCNWLAGCNEESAGIRNELAASELKVKELDGRLTEKYRELYELKNEKTNSNVFTLVDLCYE